MAPVGRSKKGLSYNPYPESFIWPYRLQLVPMEPYMIQIDSNESGSGGPIHPTSQSPVPGRVVRVKRTKLAVRLILCRGHSERQPCLSSWLTQRSATQGASQNKAFLDTAELQTCLLPTPFGQTSYVGLHKCNYQVVINLR